MPKIKAQSRLTQELLAVTDEVVWSSQIGTCAVGIKEGRATLYLGKLWRQARSNPAAREMMLRHEAFHLFLGHEERRGQREKGLWNACCDAAIHHDPTVDFRVIEAVQPGLELITYERLLETYPSVCVAPPEVVYALIESSQQDGGGGPDGFPGSDCGRGQQEDINDNKPESKAKRTEVEAEVTQGYLDDCAERKITPQVTVIAQSEQGGTGSGSRERPVIKPRPAWVDEVLDRVLHRRSSVERRRSWRREHRYLDSDLLPGRVPGQGWDGLWIIDASGSINSEVVNAMLSAVIQEPQLRGSRIAVFDSHLELPLSHVHELDQVESQIGRCGGGTTIKATDEKLNAIGYADVPRVWLTDAHSNDGLPPRREQDLWVIFGWRTDQVSVVEYPKGE